MKPALFAAPLALCLAALSPAAHAQAADAAFAATTLNLSASGEARAAPDMATLTLGVSAEAATAAEAMRADAARMTATLAAVRRAGVADRDIQTSNLNLQPQYAFPQNQPRQLTGYQASNQVTVRVQDLTRLGAVIDAAVGAGANQVESIGFGLKAPEAAENEARQAAVRALRAKADLYAQAAGYRVTRLVNLSEAGGYAPATPRPFAMAKLSAADATPVQPGTLEVRIEVSAVYELAR